MSASPSEVIASMAVHITGIREVIARGESGIQASIKRKKMLVKTIRYRLKHEEKIASYASGEIS
jgi:hypothetical protein